MESKTNKKSQNQAQRYTEQTGGCQRHGVGLGERIQKVQISGYEINKSWDVMYSMVILVNNTVSYLKVTKRVNHNSCFHKKKNCNFVW